jgi:hypothetical protein
MSALPAEVKPYPLLAATIVMLATQHLVLRVLQGTLVKRTYAGT